jgi:hypothetical protein
MAEDAADLEVLSGALQDAVAQVGDIQYEAKARRLTLGLNRFRWEAPKARGGERVRAALQLNGVMGVKAHRLRREPKDAVVSLLALTFTPGAEAPSGTVTLNFAGGGALACEVECLDAILADVSDPWPTKAKPAHDV